jgi:hypothetical protein
LSNGYYEKTLELQQKIQELELEKTRQAEHYQKQIEQLNTEREQEAENWQQILNNLKSENDRNLDLCENEITRIKKVIKCNNYYLPKKSLEIITKDVFFENKLQSAQTYYLDDGVEIIAGNISDPLITFVQQKDKNNIYIELPAQKDGEYAATLIRKRIDIESNSNYTINFNYKINHATSKAVFRLYDGKKNKFIALQQEEGAVSFNFKSSLGAKQLEISYVAMNSGGDETNLTIEYNNLEIIDNDYLFASRMVNVHNSSYVGRDYKEYFQNVRINYKEHENQFWYYEKMIEELLALTDTEILPINEFVKRENSGKRIIGLRHDVDADPITAVHCARALSRYGLSGSFYLLHTAVYYGIFYDCTFIRNPKMEEWIKNILIAGSEIGIHNDILGALKFFNTNGAEHFKSELEWMRSLGAKITGTTAHNSALTYKADNFEAFNEYKLYDKEYEYACLIGKLSAAELGIEYEATFAKAKENPDFNLINDYFDNTENAGLLNEQWMNTLLVNNPYLDWTVDYQVWIIGRDKWVFAGTNDKLFEYGVPLKRIIELLKTLEVDKKILFVLHPVYFGRQ